LLLLLLPMSISEVIILRISIWKEVVKPLLTMKAKQSSVNLCTVDKEVAHVQLSGEVQGVALQSRVLNDVQLGQGWLTGRVEASAASKAAVCAKDAGAEDVSA
jgi:hypothetical protein